LTNFTFAARIDEPQLVGMGMDVDEARRERKAGTRDALVRVAVGEVPDGDDSAVRDGDVGGVWRSAVSVVDAGPLEDRPEQRLT
jgi:hypothetical protein